MFSGGIVIWERKFATNSNEAARDVGSRDRVGIPIV
jgi:hypothetical protein